MTHPFEADLDASLSILKQNGTLLYPTDTIWGVGCDALSDIAIQKVFAIKKRDQQKTFVLLMSDVRQLSQYIAAPIPDLEGWLEQFEGPTTIIYPHAINLPDRLIAADGSIAVRITKDPFCRTLIRRLKHPLVSTSANISGEKPAAVFADIHSEVLNAVDYVVHWRRDEVVPASPSAILKLHSDGSYTKIR
ncbi:MAG: threonylcarbamoyl-AMP synthase [Chitinophagaceae bacterium]|nr:threonylcarbamoyl-AMP synthase [Chitinophagaceae bacterium]